jgi:hypothetical protein
MKRVFFPNNPGEAEKIEIWIREHTNPPYYWVKNSGFITGVYFREECDYLAYKIMFEL